MKLSIVMPARNEESCIAGTLADLTAEMSGAGIPLEIIVVDDGSTDSTGDRVEQFSLRHPEVRLVRNLGRHGFGMAIRYGLDYITGDAVAIVMADASDSPKDVRAYYDKLLEGYDCVFG